MWPHVYRSGVALSLLMALSWALTQLRAQEFDTVISSHNRQAYTVADQIEDPQERRALAPLFAPNVAAEKARLAEAFLTNFPRSWFLPQVLEIAAKAAIDLGAYSEALRYARESLELLPENPLLLVPLANVQIQQSQLAEARVSARLALEYLDELAPPLSIGSSNWPATARQLKASSYFALGRAGMTEALALARGERQRQLLKESVALLSTARQLNPEDGEIAYLLGLGLLTNGQDKEAAVNFAVPETLGGPLQSKALEQLKRIHQSSGAGGSDSFQQFLDELSARARKYQAELKRAVTVKVASDGGSASQDYAGSESCRSCHGEQHHSWQQTGMARMFQAYAPANVIGDFSSKETFYAGDRFAWTGARLESSPGKGRFPYARMFKDKGRHFFEIKAASGAWVRYPIDYTIGSKWQQAYATRLPNGQIHVFPIQYNVLHKRWLNFWQIIDPEGSARADVTTFEKFSPITSYQANCAVCHTSQLQNTKGGGFEVDHLEYRESGINCEMCHGPSGRHVSAMRAGRPYRKPAEEPPVDFAGISSREYLAICGQCHRQSAVRDAGPHGELNYWPSSPAFYPPNKSRPFGEFSRKAFYRDGRFRETTFIVESLRRSACFQKGQVNCGHCHDVHGKEAANNPKSLRFAADSDRMCTQCHQGPSLTTRGHTRHVGDSEASRCVSCHMPAIMNSMLFQARTHQIDDIPSVARLERFGREESPNACLLCHQQKDVAWLKATLSNGER
jgi:tetratricopeptide (TPR) repeat protein